MRAKDFPGTDPNTNDKFLKDVAANQQAIVAAISSLRQHEAVSLEEIGFLLGVQAGQISRYLNGTCGTTLTNYLRIVRALGYRCQIVLERLDETDSTTPPASLQKIAPHLVRHVGRTSAK